MSRNDPTEVLVAVHRDQADTKAVLVSINGDGKRALWIARSQIKSYHLIGTSTEGTYQNGVLTIPSPRKFIEIVLCFAVAAVVLCCLTLVVIVLAVFAAIESVVDRFKVRRVRR